MPALCLLLIGASCGAAAVRSPWTLATPNPSSRPRPAIVAATVEESVVQGIAFFVLHSGAHSHTPQAAAAAWLAALGIWPFGGAVLKGSPLPLLSSLANQVPEPSARECLPDAKPEESAMQARAQPERSTLQAAQARRQTAAFNKQAPGAAPKRTAASFLPPTAMANPPQQPSPPAAEHAIAEALKGVAQPSRPSRELAAAREEARVAKAKLATTQAELQQVRLELEEAKAELECARCSAEEMERRAAEAATNAAAVERAKRYAANKAAADAETRERAYAKRNAAAKADAPGGYFTYRTPAPATSQVAPTASRAHVSLPLAPAPAANKTPRPDKPPERPSTIAMRAQAADNGELAPQLGRAERLRGALADHWGDASHRRGRAAFPSTSKPEAVAQLSQLPPSQPKPVPVTPAAAQTEGGESRIEWIRRQKAEAAEASAAPPPDYYSYAPAGEAKSSRREPASQRQGERTPLQKTLKEMQNEEPRSVWPVPDRPYYSYIPPGKRTK